MDKKTVFIKTAKGERDGASLPSDLKRIMSLIDNKSRADELAKRAPPSLREGWMDFLAELVEEGYIRDKNKPYAEPKITAPKSSLLKMFTPKPSDEKHMEELDYNTTYVAPVPSAAQLAAKRKADEAARVRAEMEDAVSVAKNRASAEATAKAEAKAKLEAENAARARALIEAEEARKAEYKAKKEAESAARAKAATEAKAQKEAAAKLQEQQEAARAKAAQEAANRVRAEIEAAARAKQVAETKAKQEMAARQKAEQEAARAKAELEAAAKAKIEEEARVRAAIEAAARAQQLAEEKAKRDAEVARLKAEQEALRIKAELEAAKARAEAEAKALAEALARKAAEEKAKLAAEAEAKARQAAEEARLKAEQAAERIRAEQEAAAKRRAEAEINAATEALSRERHSEATTNGFEINLDGFLEGTTQSVAPAGQYARQVSDGNKAQEQRAAAGVNAEGDTRSSKDIAAEMARLKNEAEAARRKLEEEARIQAEEKALSEEQSRAWEEAEQRATVQAVIEVEQAAQQAALLQAKAAPAPAPRKHRKPLPVGKIAFALFTLVLIVVIVLPYIYPLDEYIAPLEQRLTTRLKQPVHIGGMSAASLPPTLKLQNVVVGNQQEVKVGNIKLNFDVFSLFSETRIISNAELEDVSIQGDKLDKQAASLKLMGGDAQYPVHHLTLQRLHIVTDEIALPVLSGIADLGAWGTFNRVSLHSADDKFDIDLESNPGHWQVSINLKESSLPILPDVVFSDLSAKGELIDGEVNFTEMDAHIFNGILLGKAKLRWSNGWQLYGNLEAKTFDLDKMFPKYHLEGEMYGEGKFSMSGDKLSLIG